MSAASSLESILARFEGVRPSGDGWTAQCPAHEDRRPSLSISERGGRILIHCFAGCSGETVIAAAGLEWADLFLDSTRPIHPKAPRAALSSKPSSEPRPDGKRQGGGSGPPTAIYHYRDERGQPLYRKLRYDHPDGGKHLVFERFGGWEERTDPRREKWIGGRGCMEGVRRVLYNLDYLTRCPLLRVYICEGEKCCDALKDCSLIATTNDDGAGKWRADYSEVLRGRDVVVLPDNDPPGKAHARLVAESLTGIARSIKVLELPGLEPGGDVYDWLGAEGYTR